MLTDGVTQTERWADVDVSRAGEPPASCGNAVSKVRDLGERGVRLGTWLTAACYGSGSGGTPSAEDRGLWGGRPAGLQGGRGVSSTGSPLISVLGICGRFRQEPVNGQKQPRPSARQAAVLVGWLFRRELYYLQQHIFFQFYFSFYPYIL